MQYQGSQHESQEGEGSRGANKQVRFSIKDGLKNIINDSNIEVEELAQRSKSLNRIKDSNKEK